MNFMAVRIPKENIIRIAEITKAPNGSADIKAYIANGMVCVMLGMLPANMSVAPNSPMALAHDIANPDMIWCFDIGNVILKKILSFEAVKILALLMISGSMAWKAFFADRSTKGEDTKN